MLLLRLRKPIAALLNCTLLKCRSHSSAVINFFDCVNSSHSLFFLTPFDSLSLTYSGEHKPPARLLAAGAGSGLAHHFTSGTLGGPAPGAKLLQTSAYEHQSILVTSVWMANRVQCAPAEVMVLSF